MGKIQNKMPAGNAQREGVLCERIEFEQLISNLASTFIHLSPDQVDGKIEDALGQIATFLNAERGTLTQRDKTGKPTARHSWNVAELPELPRIDPEEFFPYGNAKIMAGEIYKFSRLEDLPPEAELDRRTMAELGIKSHITIPLTAGGVPLGTFSFSTMRKERAWPTDQVACLQLVGTILAGALARKQADAVLRTSEARYRTLFESANDAIFLMLGEDFIECNMQTCVMFGCSHDQILGKTPFDFSPPTQPDGSDSREKGSGKIIAALKGEPQFFEWQHYRYDGTTFDVEVSLNRVYWGEQPHLLAVVRNITERKQAEENLIRSEKRYRELYEGSRDGFGLVDLEGTLIATNLSLQNMLGYTKDEIKRMTFRDITPEKWHAHEERILREQVQIRGYSDVYAKEYRRKDGTIFPVELRTYLVRDAHGAPNGYWAFVRNITDRKRAEDALRESEEKYRSLVTTIPDVVWTTDNDGNTTYISPNVERVFGFTPADVYEQGGAIWFGRIHPDDVAYVKAAYEASTEDGALFDVEYRLRHRNGHWIWLHHRAVKTTNKAGQELVSGISSDITERIQIQAELQELTEQLTAERQELKEKNITLQQILAHLEQEKAHYKDEICSSVENLLVPIIQKLKQGDGSLKLKDIDVLENTLSAIIEKDLDEYKNNLKKLTPRELDVCKLIKAGQSSKEIADSLNISLPTVHKHREIIRRKLQITNKSINLGAYLRSRS
ncbi:MAG: PAS domain S-box protein [Planctomycetota bacterium]|nr:MAG: PAS domain S-box protein [Planctomycetota bacterium]